MYYQVISKSYAYLAYDGSDVSGTTAEVETEEVGGEGLLPPTQTLQHCTSPEVALRDERTQHIMIKYLPATCVQHPIIARMSKRVRLASFLLSFNILQYIS